MLFLHPSLQVSLGDQSQPPWWVFHLLVWGGTQGIWVLPSPDSFLWGGLDIIIDVKVSQGPQDVAGYHDGYK